MIENRADDGISLSEKIAHACYNIRIIFIMSERKRKRKEEFENLTLELAELQAKIIKLQENSDSDAESEEQYENEEAEEGFVEGEKTASILQELTSLYER